MPILNGCPVNFSQEAATGGSDAVASCQQSTECKTVATRERPTGLQGRSLLVQAPPARIEHAQQHRTFGVLCHSMEPVYIKPQGTEVAKWKTGRWQP